MSEQNSPRRPVRPCQSILPTEGSEVNTSPNSMGEATVESAATARWFIIINFQLSSTTFYGG